MRDLLSQDRALSPSLVRTGITLVGAVFLALAAMIFLIGLGNVFGGHAYAGLMQIIGGLGLLFALYLLLRLLAEILMAMHRMNDKMAVLSSEIRDAQNAPKQRVRVTADTSKGA